MCKEVRSLLVREGPDSQRTAHCSCMNWGPGPHMTAGPQLVANHTKAGAAR